MESSRILKIIKLQAALERTIQKRNKILFYSGLQSFYFIKIYPVQNIIWNKLLQVLDAVHNTYFQIIFLIYLKFSKKKKKSSSIFLNYLLF